MAGVEHRAGQIEKQSGVEQSVRIPTFHEAWKTNTEKLQEMVADHLIGRPLNSPEFKAFEDYTEREVAQLPIRAKDQEQTIRHIVRQEVIKETIRTRTRDITGYEDALGNFTKLIKDYNTWSFQQIPPSGQKYPGWDSYMYSPLWLRDIRNTEETKRKQQPPQGK
jgi:hypothetical protein